MELTHRFTVPASVEETWAAFENIEGVAECFPGAQVTSVEGDTFKGTVKVKLGPIALVYNGSGEFVEKDQSAGRMVIAAKGKDKRGNGTAGATVTLKLLPDGSGSRAEVSTDLSITGKPAQFGRGVMQDVSDKLLGQFIACVEKQLGDDGAGGADADSDASSADGVTTESAAAPTDPDDGATGDTSTPEVGAGPPSTTSSRATTSTSSSGWQSDDDDAIDLGSAVGPVLAKRYGGYVLAGLVGLLIGLAFRRRKVVEVVEIPET